MTRFFFTQAERKTSLLFVPTHTAVAHRWARDRQVALIAVTRFSFFEAPVEQERTTWVLSAFALRARKQPCAASGVSSSFEGCAGWCFLPLSSFCRRKGVVPFLQARACARALVLPGANKNTEKALLGTEHWAHARAQEMGTCTLVAGFWGGEGTAPPTHHTSATTHQK